MYWMIENKTWRKKLTDPLGTELYSRPVTSWGGIILWAINHNHDDKSFIKGLFGLKLNM